MGACLLSSLETGAYSLTSSFSCFFKLLHPSLSLHCCKRFPPQSWNQDHFSASINTNYVMTLTFKTCWCQKQQNITHQLQCPKVLLQFFSELEICRQVFGKGCRSLENQWGLARRIWSQVREDLWRLWNALVVGSGTQKSWSGSAAAGILDLQTAVGRLGRSVGHSLQTEQGEEGGWNDIGP